jgi:hypothetical protein
MIETKHKIPAEWGLSTMVPIKIAGRLKHYFGYNSPLFASDTDHWDRAEQIAPFKSKSGSMPEVLKKQNRICGNKNFCYNPHSFHR